MAEEADSVLWLLRVETGTLTRRSCCAKGKKRKMSFVCKGILYKKEDGPRRKYARAQ